jgi:tRNA-splicing ligase RtcB (3'-phosphate/5'-hydroxy nucleic acid ligase)
MAVRRLDEFRWEIPVTHRAGMRVPGLVYAGESMMESIRQDQALEQVVNVAFLPGIVGHSLAMPDIHWGYGFPIGGVAATRVSDGVVSPGGVGYDINCGVRLLRTGLMKVDLMPRLQQLVESLFRNVPSGVGSEGHLRPPKQEVARLLVEGAHWAVRNGIGTSDDLDATEDSGRMEGADPSAVSERAMTRGLPQAGSLGAGNHFLEVQAVKDIYDARAASAMGIEAIGQVLVMIHTGSRGLGHQVCTDYLKMMERAVTRYGISLPDRQLACAPVESPEGRQYFAAMRCAANYAWCNRQHIAHWVREAFREVFGRSAAPDTLRQVYDVAHNIAKLETHNVDGVDVAVCVHRKGATRAFPPGHRSVPARYRDVGQPVLIPGDMGRCSYVGVGTERAMQETFGSTCHGAGRMLSRGAARKMARGEDVAAALQRRHIVVRTGDVPALAEESSLAYKDIADVMEVVEGAGICRKVARMEPLGVIKG